jgi:GNAT superfamily N-acetyltransferase
MNYQIRQATAEDIRPALDLALRVFMEYDSLDYGPEHTERMRLSIEERIAKSDIYYSGNRLMFVALDDKKVIGIVETYGNNRISLMFVDRDYQRQGIATELMSRIVYELKMSGFDKIVLNSSPNGLLFYKHFGFTINETEKNINTPWKTPMSYTINEISDVIDENGNKNW